MRIEAVTGILALETTQKIQSDITLIAEKLKTGTSVIFDRINNLINEKKELEKKLKNINFNTAPASNEDMKKVTINDHQICYSIFNNKDSKKRYRADILVEDYVSKIESKINKEVHKASKRFKENFD